MDWLFGKRKTPAELLREHKRLLDRAIRELDRERAALQTQEKRTVAEIKKMAKDGQMVRGGRRCRRCCRCGSSSSTPRSFLESIATCHLLAMAGGSSSFV